MKWNRCGHCGREGTLEPLNDVTLAARIVEVSPPGGGLDEISCEDRVQIQRCSVCGRPTFRSYSWHDFSDPTDDLSWRTLYPTEHVIDDLPPEVARRYTAMLEMLYAPDAFAVRAGKLLETLCADIGVTQSSLQSSLEKLAKEKRLPEPLAAQALLVKEYRNIGGHDSPLEVTDEDVPVLRDFVENLLEALYWGPAKLDRGREALATRGRPHAEREHRPASPDG